MVINAHVGQRQFHFLRAESGSFRPLKVLIIKYLAVFGSVFCVVFAIIVSYFLYIILFSFGSSMLNFQHGEV